MSGDAATYENGLITQWTVRFCVLTNASQKFVFVCTMTRNPVTLAVHRGFQVLSRSDVSFRIPYHGVGSWCSMRDHDRGICASSQEVARVIQA